MYIVTLEDVKGLELYSKASSKRMAFLKLEQRLNNKGISFFSDSRGRALVKLVGVPITDQELKDKLPKFKENQEIEK